MWYKLKKIYVGTDLVRPPVPPYLCFTANKANASFTLYKYGSPTAITLETSTDWENWTPYTINSTITLANIWDKVYMRNTSETTTWFSLSSSKRYYFEMVSWGWAISASWDITYLLNKNWTTTLPNSYCFTQLFSNCTWLKTAPRLPATTLTTYCYLNMFYNCTYLENIPELPATTLPNYCYQQMFNLCSKIKLSASQTWEYQTPYRIPTKWTWTVGSNSLYNMFSWTGWTFTWTPTINTTYYTSNTLV